MTEAPEPNGYELQRSIQKVEKDLGTGITEIKLIMAGLVTRDLFDYESREQNRRISDVEKSVKDFELQQTVNRWRFWTSVAIPLLAIAVSVAMVLLAG